VTSSIALLHTPFETVHLNVELLPEATPVTVVVLDEGLVIVAVPLTTDHRPLPTAGAAAFMVKVEVLQSAWSGPADEAGTPSF